MTNEWILDVLTDLRGFAISNGMPALAEQLDDTKIVAMKELTSCTERAAIERIGTDITPEPYLREVGAGRRIAGHSGRNRGIA